MSVPIQYICGPRIEVGGINAIHNDLVMGVLAPTTLAGIAHRIDCELASSGSRTKVHGAGVVVHSHMRRTGITRHTPETYTTDNASIQVEMLLDAVVSIFLETTYDQGEPDDESDALAFSVIGPILSTGRLGGGSTFPFGDPFKDQDLARLSEEEAIAWLSRYRGQVLKDAHADLAAFTPPGGDLMDALLNATSRTSTSDQPKGVSVVTPTHSPAKAGRYVPIAVGYAPIEKAKDRSARIKDTPHAYATSLTSLGRYVPVSQLARTDEGLAGSCWRYRTLGDGQAFVATTI